MSTTEQAPPHPHPAESAHGGKVLGLLEAADNFAHIIVAFFFLLMATTVVLHMGFIFAKQIPLIVPDSGPTAVPMPSVTASATTRAAPILAAPILAAPRIAATVASTDQPEDAFIANSLSLLSLILFVVILLELLRTIITYLQTHNIQAIMQEFLVVGIISSVRKILLVGAQSSLVGSKGMDFVLEATGVVIDIIGILLLIGGLIALKKMYEKKEAAHQS